MFPSERRSASSHMIMPMPGDPLERNLRRIGWMAKSSAYQAEFRYSVDKRRLEEPRVSVVVISHRRHPDTARCLNSLRASLAERGELLFVSNGVAAEDLGEIPAIADLYIELGRNTGAFMARNIGSAFARGPILLFVEDDCVPEPGIIDAHLLAHERGARVSVRGVYEPKQDSPLNRLAHHYSMGNHPQPSYAIVEGNTSYRADTFHAVGGWRDEIRFGGGGTELALRLLEHEPDLRSQVYEPTARIMHDYAVNEEHLSQKRECQRRSFDELQTLNPSYRLLRYLYRKYSAHPRITAPPPARDIDVVAVVEGPDDAKRLTTTLADTPKLRTMILVSTGEAPGAPQMASSTEIVELALPGGTHDQARAAGLSRARADVVLFVDSSLASGEMDAEAVTAHLTLHRELVVLAVHDSVEQPSIDFEFPAVPPHATNISYRRDALLRAGGWPVDSERPGPIEVALRLLRLDPDFRTQLFSPRLRVRPSRVSTTQSHPSTPARDEDRTLAILASLASAVRGTPGLVARREDPRQEAATSVLHALLEEHHFARARDLLLEYIYHHPEAAYCNFDLGLWRVLDLDVLRDMSPTPVSRVLPGLPGFRSGWFAPPPDPDSVARLLSRG